MLLETLLVAAATMVAVVAALVVVVVILMAAAWVNNKSCDGAMPTRVQMQNYVVRWWCCLPASQPVSRR